MSQNEIAKVLNITQQQYYLYESGKRQIPLNLMIMLARYYNVSLDYLAGLTDIPKPLYPGSDSKVINIKNAGHNNKFNIKQ